MQTVPAMRPQDSDSGSGGAGTGMKRYMEELYAQVVADITSEHLDRTFTYRIPETMKGQVRPGCVVQIPFGKGNRLIRGYVTEITPVTQVPAEKLKEIGGIISEAMDEEARLAALAAWMRKRYGSSMAQALRTVFPIRKKIRRPERKTLILSVDMREASDWLKRFQEKHQTARARLLDALIQEPALPMELARDKLNISVSVIRYFEETGLLKIGREAVYRSLTLSGETKKPLYTLTKAQEEIAGRIIGEMDRRWEKAGPAKQSRTHYLIHGVTGSGKTEIYMELIAHACAMGKAAIVLIPEISLTWQTVMRFRRRFGDRVSFIHSRLSDGERYDQFEKVKRGEVDVMIGPRSALFMPFSNLGIIVMDEEQEGAYQSESTPRYHAREVAFMRAEMENAVLVLGSATPSLDAYYAARHGVFTLLELPERVGGRSLPEAEIVDMRTELRSGNRSILSMRLQEEIQARLDRKEQIMLFLNRRGYAGFISCRSCGYVIKCPHCDVSLSLHRNGKMICHYCGYTTEQMHSCPSCGSGFLRPFRAGTQQVEETVAQLFPSAKILRMDLDTTQKKDAYDRMLSAFANHEADILIGTQMIVKGHDFPNVTLVGILSADLSLYVPDFRSGERTFQLITQAAGRAGRADLPGLVIVQTYTPEHYSIRCAAAQDYQSFYEQEISFREMAAYPPAGHLIIVHMSGADEARLSAAAKYLGIFARRCAGKYQGVSRGPSGNGKGHGPEVLGPVDEPVSKIQDQYRKVLFLKGNDREQLERIRGYMETYIEANEGFRDISIIYE